MISSWLYSKLKRTRRAFPLSQQTRKTRINNKRKKLSQFVYCSAIGKTYWMLRKTGLLNYTGYCYWNFNWVNDCRRDFFFIFTRKKRIDRIHGLNSIAFETSRLWRNIPPSPFRGILYIKIWDFFSMGSFS